MSGLKTLLILFMGFILIACGRSPTSHFYVLNPIPFQKQPIKPYHHLRIGIDEIELPAYLSKPQLVIHYTPHQVKLDEFHQWAGALDKNIQRVVETNLSILLPGAVIASIPWDIKFKPDYKLHINLSQFEVDINGNSILRADYLIYSSNQLSKKGTLYYHQKIPCVTTETVVASMNDNLTHFTQDIAKTFN